MKNPHSILSMYKRTLYNLYRREIVCKQSDCRVRLIEVGHIKVRIMEVRVDRDRLAIFNFNKHFYISISLSLSHYNRNHYNI